MGSIITRNARAIRVLPSRQTLFAPHPLIIINDVVYLNYYNLDIDQQHIFGVFVQRVFLRKMFRQYFKARYISGRVNYTEPCHAFKIQLNQLLICVRVMHKATLFLWPSLLLSIHHLYGVLLIDYVLTIVRHAFLFHSSAARPSGFLRIH